MKRLTVIIWLVVLAQVVFANTTVWTLECALHSSGKPSGIILYKLDSNGDVIWKKVFFKDGVIYYPRHIFQSNQGGYLITGHSFRNDSYYCFAMEIDSSGDRLREYYGTETYLDPDFADSLIPMMNEICSIYEQDWEPGWEMAITRDDSISYSLRVWGWECYRSEGHLSPVPIDSGFVSVNNSAYYAINVYRFNKVRNHRWNKSYKLPYDCLYEGNSIKFTADGGFIVAGSAAPVFEPESYKEIWGMTGGGIDWPPPYTRPTHSAAFVVKIDSQGDTIWTRTYGGDEPGIYDFGESIAPTSDGGYVLLVRRMKSVSIED